MRDDSARWSPLPSRREPVDLPGVRLSEVRIERQTMLSGPVAHALAVGGQTSAVGWPELAVGDAYAVRLRRDRVLSVNGAALPDGWHDQSGVAVSDMTGALVVLEVSGPDALAVLKRGTEIEIADPSASVSRRFFGHGAMIYHHAPIDEGEAAFRIHVARATAHDLWTTIRSVLPK